ncbi:NAD(P)H-dependent flavin oxidoreductase [Klebsiella sp. MISC125]|uniref:NAD(P)H-dependent flavin oxidoreductase n=1 Tax=Klebsiella sp. MISC125 TaxID=2755386 RepID=UPI003DA8F8F6
MSNRLTQQLDIDYPIIQAPMAGVSTPELAAAVSHAGALGSLGLGSSTVAQAEALINRTRQLTTRPFNVNLFCHDPAIRDPQREAQWIEQLRPEFSRFNRHPPETLAEIYLSFQQNPQMAELLLDLAPAVISFHFGIPDREVIRRMREKGIVTLASATCVKEALWIAAHGIDMVVAQGYEAGGHRGMFDPLAPDGQMSTFTLVQALKQQMELPIIAAGGIMDGAGINSVMNLGAEGVQLGTAFLLCPESAADAGYRQAIKDRSDGQTFLTSAISGRPARCIANGWREMKELHAVPAYPVAYDVGKALATAAKAQGDHQYGAHWAGQGVNLIRELSAAELIQTLISESGFQ